MTNLDDSYGIDERSEAIASYEGGILVCMAGPGTGKTFSFLKRANKLIVDSAENPDCIAYLTFVKQISDAFIDDYNQDDYTIKTSESRPRISTLHSFACRLLRNQGFLDGYSDVLYFLDIASKNTGEIDAEKFLNDLLPYVRSIKIRTVPNLRKVFDETIKPAWRDCRDLSTLDVSASLVLSNYLMLSKVYRLIDWDHAIPFAHSIFHRLSVPPDWLANYRHFLIDEYQDFNRAEQSFINTLASRLISTVIVGDDDQSLYSGRGGSPDGLRELYNSPNIDCISLVRCFRCKPVILNAANKFLQTMRSHPHLMIPEADTTGGVINCFSFKSRKSEIEYLVQFIAEKLQQINSNSKLKEGIVCLFPNKKALVSYMEIFRKIGIPCYSKQQKVIPERRRLMLALELVAKPSQRFIERLLLEEYPEIKTRHKSIMLSLMLEEDIGPSNALEMMISRLKFPDRVIISIKNFIDLCQKLSSKNPEVITEIIADRLPTPVLDLEKHIALFLSNIVEMNSEDAISKLCDILMPETARPAEVPTNVLFTTMHGAKGLTRKTVIMPGLERAWLPGSVGNIDEKKRMFYVSLTRATDEVLITYPKTRPPKDPLNYKNPGRSEACPFIAESGIVETFHI